MLVMQVDIDNIDQQIDDSIEFRERQKTQHPQSPLKTIVEGFSGGAK